MQLLFYRCLEKRQNSWAQDKGVYYSWHSKKCEPQHICISSSSSFFGNDTMGPGKYLNRKCLVLEARNPILRGAVFFTVDGKHVCALLQREVLSLSFNINILDSLEQKTFCASAFKAYRYKKRSKENCPPLLF